MNFLEQNLSTLKKIDAILAEKIAKAESSDEYQVLTARNGLPTLKVDGISLHSAYDPLKEAERLAESLNIETGKTVLLKGFGLGYLAEELIKKGHYLVVTEADITVLRCALKTRDLSALLEKVKIFAGEPASHFQKFLKANEIFSDLIEVTHNPSVKLNANFYHYLLKPEKPLGFNQNQDVSLPKGLKILLPSPLYGGSLPIAGYCKRALEDLGHKVEYFDSSQYYYAYKSVENATGNKEHQGKLRSLLAMFISEMVLAKALEYKPDLVFGIAQSPFSSECLAEYRKLKIPVAFWFMEDFRLFTYWKTFAQLYDYFFVIQRGDFPPNLEQMGVKHHYYLPLAADPEVHKVVELTEKERSEFASELSFLGAGYYNRAQFFLQLLNEDFKIWGTEWEANSPLRKVLQRNGARISTEDCVKIFNASAINLNLHSSSYHNGVNPHGDFVNPRTFEIAACGAFQLIDPRSELPELFQIGTEIETFKDIEELRRKKKYYLEHPEERKAIAESGQRRVLAQHTYRLRMEEMLYYIAKNEPEWRNKGESPNLARNLANAAGEDAELRNFFQRFSPEEELNIDKIANTIRQGKGELTQTEAVFLLMKEFYDWAREKKVI